jgi:hypothetical protein
MHQIEFIAEATIAFVSGVGGPKGSDKTNMTVLRRTSGGGNLKPEVVRPHIVVGGGGELQFIPKIK